MRFGTFVLPISPDPNLDNQIIDTTLNEAVLADSLGLDAVWLSEHYFGGETAYADPVVFAAAVAVLTHRIRIGFAVIQMAFHHPVSLAAQTALLDNLSHGRLIVGTGRGSAYNTYEYLGFGTTMEEGRERLGEAEELLLKAWTEENLSFHGQHWDVKFPIVRPRPYQIPHPPLVRACIGEASVAEMAQIGRPVLIGPDSLEITSHYLRLYEDTMEKSGFSEVEIQNVLNECWVSKSLYVAETTNEAMEEATTAFEQDRLYIRQTRHRFNPTDHPNQVPQRPRGANQPENYLIAGSPERVAEEIAVLRDAGVRNLIFTINSNHLGAEKGARSMRLFAEKVLPLFRGD